MSVLHNPIACTRLNVNVLFDYLWMRSWPRMRPHSNLVVKKVYLRQGALLQLVGNRCVYFPVRPITASPIAQMRLLRCLRYSLALK